MTKKKVVAKRPVGRPRVGTAKPTRASTATKKKPTKRLVSRRVANTKKGFFPNPSNRYTIPVIQIAPDGHEYIVCKCEDIDIAHVVALILSSKAKKNVSYIARSK